MTVRMRKQIDSLLKTLDSRLNDFQQVLPRLDPCHGLLDVGGLELKQIFRTATVTDVHAIHGFIEKFPD